jgi:hypothetical protein
MVPDLEALEKVEEECAHTAGFFYDQEQAHAVSASIRCPILHFAVKAVQLNFVAAAVTISEWSKFKSLCKNEQIRYSTQEPELLMGAMVINFVVKGLFQRSVFPRLEGALSCTFSDR